MASGWLLVLPVEESQLAKSAILLLLWLLLFRWLGFWTTAGRQLCYAFTLEHHLKTSMGNKWRWSSSLELVQVLALHCPVCTISVVSAHLHMTCKPRHALIHCLIVELLLLTLHAVNGRVIFPFWITNLYICILYCGLKKIYSQSCQDGSVGKGTDCWAWCEFSLSPMWQKERTPLANCPLTSTYKI